ncbi:MAG: acyl-CoA thioesterase II [Pseudomonadales bacterium]|nr:acyl-CoA thioesterase II [Pseudomonadales bacterium]
MTLLERLIHRLDLKACGPDQYIGGAGAGGVTENARLFGGLVAAQATMAALRTVDGFTIHSLHAYFLAPGRPDENIVFTVSRAKQGRNFAARNVTAEQNGHTIFQLQASFQRPVEGVDHQSTPADVPPAEALPNRDQIRGRLNWREMPIDIRMVTPITDDSAQTPEQKLWLRANGTLPEDPHIHLAMIVYASDRCLLDTAWRPHADQGTLAAASLDHSMWFHQPPRFDDWLLYATQSPRASGGRGLALGTMYNRQGQHLLSVAQEGMLRVRTILR